MNIDVNQAKSRAFNLHLRFLQFSLSLLVTFLVASTSKVKCVQQDVSMIRGMSLIMIGLNIIALLLIKFRPHHPKTGFLILYGINIICCISLIIYSAVNLQSAKFCIIRTLHLRYYLSITPIYLILSVMILSLPFYWVQRFTNSPGVIIWPVLLFTYAKTAYGTIKGIMGVLAVITCLVTWLTNIFAFTNGVTTTIKKFLVVGFVIGLAFTAINSLLSLVGALSITGTTLDDKFSKLLLLSFMLTNSIDLAFWLLGLMSLQYQNGDLIRDGLLQYGVKQQNKQQQLQVAGEDLFTGTLK